MISVYDVNFLTPASLSVTHCKWFHKLDFPQADWPMSSFPAYRYPLEKYAAENRHEDVRCLYEVHWARGVNCAGCVVVVLS